MTARPMRTSARENTWLEYWPVRPYFGLITTPFHVVIVAGWMPTKRA